MKLRLVMEMCCPLAPEYPPACSLWGKFQAYIRGFKIFRAKNEFAVHVGIHFCKCVYGILPETNCCLWFWVTGSQTFSYQRYCLCVSAFA